MKYKKLKYEILNATEMQAPSLVAVRQLQV